MLIDDFLLMYMKIEQRKYGLVSKGLSAIFIASVAAITLLISPPALASSMLEASDAMVHDFFGQSVSASGDNALVGASGNLNQNVIGSAYYYKELTGESDVVNQSVKLLASDGHTKNNFGYSMSLSGDKALIGAQYADNSSQKTGAVYYFKGLDNKSGIVNQDVKLLASDRAIDDYFGIAVSLSGDNALVGANYDDDKGTNSGSVYYFKGLDGKTGTITQNIKLLASDGAADDYFGQAISLSGDNALVGSYGDDDKGSGSGSAYYFKELNNKSGTVNQDVKLLASDGKTGENFGMSVSLSGNKALVGTANTGGNGGNGAAYYFKGLNGKAGTITQDIKLIASDGRSLDGFGRSLSLSDDHALVGAYYKDSLMGAAYYFKGLDNKSGTVSQDVLLFASVGAKNNRFAWAVSLSVNRFVISNLDVSAASAVYRGKVYAGDIRAFSTLDAGNASLSTGGISFTPKEWVIGGNTDNNAVTLSEGDMMTNNGVNGADVYIGKNAGSDNNLLVVEGMISARGVYVGAPGNIGNTLLLEGDGDVVSPVYISPANRVGVPGTLTLAEALMYFPRGYVYMPDSNGDWVAIDSSMNIPLVHENGYTYIVGRVLADAVEPTIPAKIKDMEAWVDPAYPDEVVITGNINADPENPDESQVFDYNKMIVYTATDLFGTWSLAPANTYMLSLSNEGKSFKIIVDPTVDSVRFYRVATSLADADISGVFPVEALVTYHAPIIGQYKVTIPAGKQQIVSVQVKARTMTVDGLFASLPNRSLVGVQNIDPQSAQYGSFASVVRRPSGAGWLANGTLAVRLGQGLLVTNAGSSASTLNFVGTVSADPVSFTGKKDVKVYWGATVPMAVATPVDLGYTLGARDTFARLTVSTGVYTSYVVRPNGTGWLTTAPSFVVGEGFLFQASAQNTTWTQGIVLREDNLSVSLR